MLTLNVMLPALVVLALALAVGVWIALALRRRAPVEPMRDVLDDAEERVSRLLAHLRELALQQDRTDAETYAKERAELESRAAQAMRERDQLLEKRGSAPQGEPAEAPSSSSIVRFLQKRPALRGALWATGIFVVGGALFYFVQRDQKPGAQGGMAQAMGDGAAPAQAMGDGGLQQRVDMPPFITAEMPTDGEVQGLIAELRQNPRDVGATVRLGHLLIAGRMFEEARILTDRALQLDPTNPEALAHAAALHSVQDRDGGLAQLDALVKKQPKLAEAWLFRGMIGLQTSNTALMQESFQKYLAVAPEGPEREHVRSILNGTATSASP